MSVKVSAGVLLSLLLFPAFAFAQRDSPVWDSYLSSIALNKKRETIGLSITFNKGGGPHEQWSASQMYMLGYLEIDEAEILKLASEERLTDKSGKQSELLLDVLLKKKLVTVLDSKVHDKNMKPAVEIELEGDEKSEAISVTNFNFEFALNNNTIYKQAGELKNFERDNSIETGKQLSEKKLKLMVFVPVNDCIYATKIPKAQRDFYDFAHFMDTKTILQYFKPLPYRFQFKPLDKEDLVLVYVD